MRKKDDAHTPISIQTQQQSSELKAFPKLDSFRFMFVASQPSWFRYVNRSQLQRIYHLAPPTSVSRPSINSFMAPSI